MTATQRSQAFSTGVYVAGEDDMSSAVNAFLLTAQKGADGGEERRRHLATIRDRFWLTCFGVISVNFARNRDRLDFTDEERRLIDLGVVDVRMFGGDQAETARRLDSELNAVGYPGIYYLSEWLWHRFQQVKLADSVIDDAADGEPSRTSPFEEVRKRVLARLSGFFDGLPGIPGEVAGAMRSGGLDDAILDLSVSLLRKSARNQLIRRRNLWQLREQVIAKARARAKGQNALKLFDALNEIYEHDWHARFAEFLRASESPPQPEAQEAPVDDTTSQFTLSGQIVLEMRQLRMRLSLAAAANGDPRADVVLATDAPRLTKDGVAGFLPVLQSFDRSLGELPPLVIVPGVGRGMFAWENGCVFLSVRPSVGLEDSVATAFAYQRMLDDRLNRDGSLRKAYEAAFPGSIFRNEFPVDYRAWLCRLTHGDSSAMSPERRAFFREHVGPELGGPLLPVNLRNIGPQTRDVICRRLEKQITAGDRDFKLNHRLGALYWYQGEMDAAAMQFTAAVRLAPNDGETLFTAGMFMRARDDARGADILFRCGAEQASDTLWGIYCRDALENVF